MDREKEINPRKCRHHATKFGPFGQQENGHPGPSALSSRQENEEFKLVGRSVAAVGFFGPASAGDWNRLISESIAKTSTKRT